MITGAYAVSYYGMPRATHDLDVVIDISHTDVDRIYKELKKTCEIDKDMVENAAMYRTHFSIIYSKGDLRADLWVLKDKPVENTKFERMRKVSLFGVQTFIISPEDILLTKLDWYNRSKNTKHMDDAVGIIRVQGKKLDAAYIKKMLVKLDIEKYWGQAVELSKQ
jgi:hypothetical protein